MNVFRFVDNWALCSCCRVLVELSGDELLTTGLVVLFCRVAALVWRPLLFFLGDVGRRFCGRRLGTVGSEGNYPSAGRERPFLFCCWGLLFREEGLFAKGGGFLTRDVLPPYFVDVSCQTAVLVYPIVPQRRPAPAYAEYPLFKGGSSHAAFARQGGLISVVFNGKDVF